ncbi:GntR family transcriptional regulator [Streptomyces sp. NPDC004436]
MGIDPDEPTALYRLYDNSDVLLYVGISKHPERRWTEHAVDRSDTWWPLVAAKRVEWFATRKEAESAEVATIRAERPVHNRDHAPRDYQQSLREASDKQAVFKRGRSDFGAVASLMQAEIDAGYWPAGERLPIQRELLRKYLITQSTLQRALQRLLDAGVVADPSGCGHYIAVGPGDRPVSIHPTDLAAAAELLRAHLHPQARIELARLLTATDEA